MASEIGEAPASGLGKLLQDERFLVPTHQRDYSWSIDEVALLLDDVEAAYDRGDKQYFVGLMVFMGADGPEQLVLDGQQRLATAHYNLVRVHRTLRVTPAMEAGVSNRLWSLDELVERTSRE